MTVEVSEKFIPEIAEIITYCPVADALVYRADNRPVPFEINNRGYCRVKIDVNGKEIRPTYHRLMAELLWEIDETHVVDHIDNDKQNNKKSNLRILDKSCNGLNRKMKANGMLPGVQVRPNRPGYLVSHTIGDQKFLKTVPTLMEANRLKSQLIQYSIDKCVAEMNIKPRNYFSPDKPLIGE